MPGRSPRHYGVCSGADNQGMDWSLRFGAEVGKVFPRDLVLKGYAQPSRAKDQKTKTDADWQKWRFLRGLRMPSTQEY